MKFRFHFVGFDSGPVSFAFYLFFSKQINRLCLRKSCLGYCCHRLNCRLPLTFIWILFYCPIYVSNFVTGPIMSKFISAFRELATYKELLRTQVSEYFIIPYDFKCKMALKYLEQIQFWELHGALWLLKDACRRFMILICSYHCYLDFVQHITTLTSYSCLQSFGYTSLKKVTCVR